MALLKFNDYTLEISFPRESNYQFMSLKLEESSLGKLPTAELKVRCDSDVCNLLDKAVISITPPNSNKLTTNMYVYSLKYLNGDLIIKLITATTEFLRVPHTNAFSNIKNAVSSLYPGRVISNTESDLLNEVKIYQKNETDYNLTKRLLQAWKKNTVFGFSLDGVRINDLTNFKSLNDELADRTTLDQVDFPEYSNPKMYGMDIKFIDYSSGVDANHQYVVFNDTYIPVNNEYKDLIGNYLYNKRFETTPLIANFTTRYLYNLNLVDGVRISSPESKLKRFNTYLSSRTISIDQSDIKIDYTFRAINNI